VRFLSCSYQRVQLIQKFVGTESERNIEIKNKERKQRYEGGSKSSRTESLTKYTLNFGIAC
jgi:hypothetical protein